jgi:hypothetical protein
MLAVKLHRTRRPWLGRGSHLVPILKWSTGRVRVRNWIRTLESGWRGGPNHTIGYLTLVRIPEQHPVALEQDWIDKYFQEHRGLLGPGDERGHVVLPALRDIPASVKQELLEWSDGGPRHPLPEFILGAPLPASQILWTKSRWLLYGNRHRRPT